MAALGEVPARGKTQTLWIHLMLRAKPVSPSCVAYRICGPIQCQTETLLTHPMAYKELVGTSNITRRTHGFIQSHSETLSAHSMSCRTYDPIPCHVHIQPVGPSNVRQRTPLCHMDLLHWG